MSFRVRTSQLNLTCFEALWSEKYSVQHKITHIGVYRFWGNQTPDWQPGTSSQMEAAFYQSTSAFLWANFLSPSQTFQNNPTQVFSVNRNQNFWVISEMTTEVIYCKHELRLLSLQYLAPRTLVFLKQEVIIILQKGGTGKWHLKAEPTSHKNVCLRKNNNFIVELFSLLWRTLWLTGTF